MADETPPSSFDPDFDAIEAAVLETARGRWFLAEFARRNRAAETDKLFEAIQRLERTADEAPDAPAPAAPVEPPASRTPPASEEKPPRDDERMALLAARQEATALRADLGAILDNLASANAAMLAIGPATAGQVVAPDAKGFDRMIDNPGDASATILAAAELIQEQVWMLREGGAAPRLCDTLDRSATQIFAACAFGELAGRRAIAVLQAMSVLNERARLIRNRLGTPPAPAHAARQKPALPAARENDLVFAPATPPASPRSLPEPRAGRAPSLGAQSATKPTADRPPRPATLADIDALTAREKLRLFT